jgi:hypothetical protein
MDMRAPIIDPLQPLFWFHSVQSLGYLIPLLTWNERSSPNLFMA